MGACPGTECLNECLTFGDFGLQQCFQSLDLGWRTLGVDHSLELLLELENASLDSFQLDTFSLGKLRLLHPLEIDAHVPATLEGFGNVGPERREVLPCRLRGFDFLLNCLAGFTDLLTERLECGQLCVSNSLVCGTDRCRRVCTDGGNSYQCPKTNDNDKDDTYQSKTLSCHVYLHNSRIASGCTYWTVKGPAMFTACERQR